MGTFELAGNLLSTTEASELLRVSPETVTALIQSGKIRAFRCGKNWRVFRDSIDQMIKQTLSTN
jgi:excisionase family DNA binding protein